MTLKTQMTTDLSVFFNSDEFAESVTYAGTAITAVVEFENLEAGNAMTAERTVQRAVLYVKTANVAAPAYRDAVVIGGVTWYVIHIPGKSDNGVWKLGIETSMKPVL